jgi:hypothetical protein
MSKIFYDDIIDLKEVEKHVKLAVKNPEEREEMYKLIDDILHHRLLYAILEKLPKEHHKEFMHRFAERPHDESHLVYLSARVQEDVKEFIKQEVRMLSTELLAIIYEKTEPAE